ncbi:hypothetical protein LZ023_10360 [Pseudomonas silvicola]|nr:hypothetical protein LZ023_10360 [Pseudomonas silvicola]
MGQYIGYGLGASGPFLAGWLHVIWGNWDAPLLVLVLVAAACLQVIFAILAGRDRLAD